MHAIMESIGLCVIKAWVDFQQASYLNPIKSRSCQSNGGSRCGHPRELDLDAIRLPNEKFALLGGVGAGAPKTPPLSPVLVSYRRRSVAVLFTSKVV